MLSYQISQLRAELGVSRAAVVPLLGVSEATLVRWETGTGTAPRGLQLAILQALRRVVEERGSIAARQIVLNSRLHLGQALSELFLIAYGDNKSQPPVQH